MKTNMKTNSIMYSSYLMHHSTTNKVEKTENSFNNKLFESNNYFRIIDEFYDSLRKHQKKYNDLHNSSLNYYVNLIVAITKDYNKTYLHLKKINKKNHALTSDALYLELKKFKFNLNQIGIKINSQKLIDVNLFTLKNKLKTSYSYIDFLFEEHGLINNLKKLYPNSKKNGQLTHINKKV